MMTGAVAYLFILLMVEMAISCLLKLSCLSVRGMAAAAVVWGLAGYVSVMIASETGNLQNGLSFHTGLIFAITFIECGMMIAYVFRARERRRSKDIVSLLLHLFPGVTILLPIMYGAVCSVRALTGISFSMLGISFGIAVGAIIFLSALLIKKIKPVSEIKPECIYSCAIATILTSIIICGLQNQY